MTLILTLQLQNKLCRRHRKPCSKPVAWCDRKVCFHPGRSLCATRVNGRLDKIQGCGDKVMACIFQLMISSTSVDLPAATANLQSHLHQVFDFGLVWVGGFLATTSDFFLWRWAFLQVATWLPKDDTYNDSWPNSNHGIWTAVSGQKRNNHGEIPILPLPRC